MPFVVETLTATTEENIGSRTQACTISASDEVAKVTGLIQSAGPTSESFADRFVRVRIARVEAGKETVLAVVDREGRVRGGAPGVRRLANERLAELKSFLGKRCEW